MAVYYRASFDLIQIQVMPPRLAIVLKGYPRLSETFIAQEIRALELRGFELCIFSLRHPYDPDIHPVHAEIEAVVHYLPEYLHDDIARVLRACLWICVKPRFWLTLVTLLRDFWRDPSRNRLRRFGQAIVMAHETPASVRLYYTHFSHTPASVSYYASKITGRPWSLSAHAKDIWTIPRWELREKLASADWVVTCTRANLEYLSQLAGRADRVTLLYHGLDFDRFASKPREAVTRDGGDPQDPVRLLSVGRAVDKKGYDILLEALAGLGPGLHWQFVHIGGGELLEQLRRRAQALGLDGRIEWLGALPQADVLAQYRAADLFVLPSKISADGDRDGLPNVLMEAQSQHLACLSTDVSGIPELIEHARTGWLVEQKNPEQLGEALEKLIREPQLRDQLAQAGYQRVRQAFSMKRGIETLVGKLGHTLDADQRS